MATFGLRPPRRLLVFSGYFDRAFIGRFAAKLRSYGMLLRWLFVDSIVRFRRDAFKVTVFAIGSIGAQMLAFLVINSYASALEQDLGFDFGAGSLSARSFVALAIAGTSIFILSVLAAVLSYLSQRGALQLWGHYEVFCSKRAISLATRATWAKSVGASWDDGDDAYWSVLQKDARYSGIVLRLLALTIIPALQLVLYFGVMVFLDAQATLIILAINACTLGFLYGHSRDAARYSNSIEKQAKEAAKKRQALVQSAMSLPTAVQEDDPRLSAVFDQGENRQVIQAILGRVDLVKRTDTTVQIAASFSIAFVVVVMGTQAIATGYGWGNILIYLLALYGGTSGLRTVSRTVTAVNRFYPQLHRHFRFISGAAPGGIGDKKDTGRFVPLFNLGAEPEPLCIKAGDRIALIKPGPVSRSVFKYLWAVLAQSTNAPIVVDREGFFVTMRAYTEKVALRDFLGLKPEVDEQRLSSLLKDVDGELSPAVSDLVLGDPNGHASWQRLSDQGKAALLVAAAVLSDAQVIAFDAAVLAGLPPLVAQKLLRHIKSQLILIVYTSMPDAMPRFDERLCLIAGDRGPMGYIYAREFGIQYDKLSKMYVKIAARLEKKLRTKRIEDNLEQEEEA
ncbi:MAG: hypothetical protein ACREYF_18685 [Gammaproteobacteria bacterium]